MNIYYVAAGYQNDRGMANSKEPKNYVCSLCNKSMNRKISFEKHRKNCVEKTKGDFISIKYDKKYHVLQVLNLETFNLTSVQVLKWPRDLLDLSWSRFNLGLLRCTGGFSF